MPTSATGTSTNSSGRAALPARRSGTGVVSALRHTGSRGFTLIEILVVLLIIGIMIAGAVLTVGVAADDQDLEKERDRLLALMDYQRDQAALQNREIGLRFTESGYEFLAFDPRTGQWQALTGDSITRPRRLPAGITASVRIEGRDIVLPAADGTADADEPRVPQVLLYSSGELNLFEVTLQRAGGAAMRLTPARGSDGIEVERLAPEAT